MAGPLEHQLTHIDGLIDRSAMAGKLVAIVGVGAVGSQVANELTRYAVGRLRMIDPDHFTIANSSRHALPIEYAEDSMPWNKAEGMAVYLETQARGRLHPQAIPRKIDDAVSNGELDQWLADADLIVATTDEREAQRRIGRRALALDIPAVFPGLYEGRGGEVFIQRSPRQPCFFCWDGWRPGDQTVRGAAAGNADILDVIALTTKLCVGILDQTSNHRRFLAGEPGESQPPQLFIVNDYTTARRPVPRRPDCPSCGVGPAPRTQETGQNSVTEPLPRWPAPPPRPGKQETLLATVPATTSSGFLDAPLVRLGMLAGALALLALPFGIEALWAPVFNRNQHNLLVDLAGLTIGLGCFGLLLVGLATVVMAISNLFTGRWER